MMSKEVLADTTHTSFEGFLGTDRINQRTKEIERERARAQPMRAPMVLGDIPRMQYQDNGLAQISIDDGIERILTWRGHQ
jgi:hypothetical protein